MDLELLLFMLLYWTPLNALAIIYITITCKLVQDGAKILSPNPALMCSLLSTAILSISARGH
jgi:hypothetical protein